ncbi:MAG: efflux RND transporter permease subunit, partial [Gammaproteobacteria bacterium]
MSFPNLSALAVQQRSVTLYFLLLSILAGLYAFLSLGRAEDPQIKMQVQVVSVIWPGATAQQIQQQVVDPIEKKIQELDYLYRVQTTIKAGRADIQVEHQDYTPNEKQSELQFQIRKRMLDIAPQLPDGVLGPFVNDDFSDIYFSLFSLTAPGLPMRDLTREAERIRDRLRSVPGALKVNLIGERAERVYVNLDTVKLLNLGITGDQVFDAIDAYNHLLPAGQLETAGPRLQFRVQADLADTRQLEAVPIRVGNTTLRLGDIATVWQGY